MNHSYSQDSPLSLERTYRRLKELEENRPSFPHSEYRELNRAVHQVMEALKSPALKSDSPFHALENEGIYSIQIAIKALSSSAKLLQSTLQHCATIMQNPLLSPFLETFFQRNEDFYIELAFSNRFAPQEFRIELFHGDRRPLLSSQFYSSTHSQPALASFTFGDRSPSDHSLSAVEQLFFTQAWVKCIKNEFLRTT